MAARVAKAQFLADLTRPETLAALASDPKPTLELAFVNAHRAIEAAFRKYYEDAGWHVQRTADGYLIRSRQAGGSPLCVHGGSTATVAMILQGRRLLVANVGDSTAIVCGLDTAGDLKGVEEWTPMGGAATATAATTGSSSSSSASSSGGTGSAAAASVSAPPALPIHLPPSIATSYMEVSADHSPESETEFMRMHKYRPHATSRHTPELLFVYDTLTASKLACPPIFDVHPHTGKCTKTERGSYYKNVRCEWATLVATPPHAGFQDALAFTRSLGDLHLQSYGVSHTPEIWWMDLTTTAAAAAAADAEAAEDAGMSLAAGAETSAAAAASASGASEVPLVRNPVALAVCSDGIWDNWKFEEVAGFLLTPSRLADLLATRQSDAASNDLMAANLDRARANFGSSADNMTAISE
jgi:serine/threonine protein phosphatase PrpC